ncbi:uncharacterized protein LOC131547576 isoform X2 [Onychostoma macrolepis]|uniref:uncharacterized protein LOC131547576 isoform X2 n=1 Tax=Onychostoma macrolepis TaxID=369639 RepID=UPI00272A667C|nr:uncharacterized protein LOC131547576 isoform X2 [Onychostoma macrolepis]
MDPPFSYVGLDVFGPWEVITHCTRGGQANSKRWAVLFTCMFTRGVHIEVIESMTSSSLINALRRFFSIRGPAKQLRSDCGMNFVGASRELKMSENEQTAVREYLLERRCSWVFNPPHSSHMGGAWEHMIGITRRILDSMLLKDRYTQLTHEVLVTFMSEVTAIINAQPLVPVSTDPEFPFIQTPSMLLTQKAGNLPTPPEDFSKKDMLQCQWKRVQALSETFWNMWRKDYLGTLQSRRKWFHKHRNIKEACDPERVEVGQQERTGEDEAERKIDDKDQRGQGEQHEIGQTERRDMQEIEIEAQENRGESERVD